MFGPLLIFDKSFLQMLSAEEVFELTLNYNPVGTPLIIREIIADLRKIPRNESTLPAEIVRVLARKMSHAHGVQPADFRKLVISNLCGANVPMFGQVPVDPSAPNVASSPGGGMLYDAVPEQRMWSRWAMGDFSADDEESAAKWRDGLARVDLHAVGTGWKDFARTTFPRSSNLRELIDEVDSLLRDPSPTTQLDLLRIILSFVQAPAEVRNLAFEVFLIGTYKIVLSFAPYAASVLKLYLVFVAGIARGFIGPRPSHFVDLQYLLYAPFCMVFVSADKFQRDMWPATAGINTFVWGPDMKADLARRVVARRRMSTEDLRAHGQTHGYPLEIEGSITNELWKRYMRPQQEVVRHSRYNPR